MTLRRNKRRPVRPPPPVVPEPPLPPETVVNSPPPAQVLKPFYAVESKDEIMAVGRGLDRKAGAKKRHEDMQFTDADRAAIDAYRGRKPNASSTAIAI